MNIVSNESTKCNRSPKTVWMDKDTCYKELDLMPVQTQQLKKFIEENYFKKCEADQICKGGEISGGWLPRHVAFLTSGKVFVLLPWKTSNNGFEVKEKRIYDVFKGRILVIDYLKDLEDIKIDELNNYVKLINRDWEYLELPHQYLYVSKTEDYLSSRPGYYTEFPKENVGWYPIQEPTTNPQEEKISRNTSIVWKSNRVSNLAGLAFLGRITKQVGNGHEKNEFAIFFHENELYNGGYEYGWVFKENEEAAIFYIEKNANLGSEKGEVWEQWPYGNGAIRIVNGDLTLKNSLKELDCYKNWKIEILDLGDFKVEISNPDSGESKSCILKKPDDFPNFKGMSGFVTITAKKAEDNNDITTHRTIHVKEVKVLA